MKSTLLAALVVLQLAPFSLVRAQSEDDDQDPGRGVARISVINGDVSVRRSDSGDWVAATINAPVIVPDTVFSGAGARAEIQLDYANLARLAANTEVRFSELENGKYQLQISRGTVTFSILRDSKADIDLSTPNVSVRPYKKGRYRVTVREDGTTEVTVRSGQAEIFTPRGAETLRAGRSMVVRGTASEPEFQLVGAVPQDEWDRWNEDRDKELSRSNVYRYVSNDVYGAEDLDPYGRWVNVPPYGWVWSPQAAPGWAPYRYGRWSWLDWYGWTWVSYDPWGWAPYHYGRWFNQGSYGWCWWPGGYRERHHWRPALVGFFGWGRHSGVNIGIGFGHVGWVPLAPYERYHPWYGRRYYQGYRNSTHIDNSVNIVNNVNVTNIYRNSRVGNGITAINGADFGRGRVSNIYRASNMDLRRVDLVRGQMPVVPQRESLSLSDRQVRAVATPTGRDQFASRRTARQADTVPFSQQQQGIERASRQVFNQQENPRLGQSGAAVAAESPREGNSPASRMGVAGQTSRGWRRDTDSPRGAESGASISGRAVDDQGTARPGGSSEGRGGARSSGGASVPAATSGVERSRGGDWRRFGEAGRPESSSSAGDSGAGLSRRSSGAEGRGVGDTPRAGQSGPSSTDAGRAGDAERSRASSWRRFGEPARSSDVSRPESTDSSGGSRSSGWNRSGDSGADSSGGSVDRRSRSGAAGESSGRSDSGSRYESVPIRPPIVQERSNSRSDRSERWSGGGSDSGSSSRETPRWSGGGRTESGGGGRSGGVGGGGSIGSGGSRSGGGGSVSSDRSGGGGGDRSSGASPRSSGGGRSGRNR